MRDSIFWRAVFEEEVGAAATQVLGSADDLSRQSERLKLEVESFLVTVRAA
ncbi:MAG TPA: hypothetical protein VGD08_14095 [Stellaceae bacterium]